LQLQPPAWLISGRHDQIPGCQSVNLQGQSDFDLRNGCRGKRTMPIRIPKASLRSEIPAPVRPNCPAATTPASPMADRAPSDQPARRRRLRLLLLLDRGRGGQSTPQPERPAAHSSGRLPQHAAAQTGSPARRDALGQ
jgi:hypothetical protein